MDKKVIKYLSKAPEKKENRVLRFVGSDQSIDRDNERIITEGWKLTNYKKNPVVLVNHQAYELPVAKTKKVWIDKEGKKLMFDIQFPEPDVSSIGDTLYKLYSNGFMNATSVGFSPNPQKITYGDGKKQPRVTFGEQELLEISLVSVPANPRALLSQKNMKDAIDAQVIDDVELTELQICLDELFGDKDDIEVKKDEFDAEQNPEQTLKKHICAECGDELICVKCKGFIRDTKDSDYLDYFFEDLDEPATVNIKSDDEENYIDELLNILKTESQDNG